MKKEEKKPRFRHFKYVDGKKVEFDPRQDEEIAERCLLALGFIVFGEECELVDKK